jgi:nucleoid-associated protein YgaU
MRCPIFSIRTFVSVELGLSIMGTRRLAALAALLLGGACAALPFLKSPAAAGTHQAVAQESTDAVATLALPTIAVESAAAQVPSPAPPFAAPVSWHEPTPIALPAGDEPLPTLPRVPVVHRAPRDAAARIGVPDFNVPVPAAVRPVELPRRKHRIVDGDSLSLLALRYLGDSSRAEEIARLNRDVLRDPNLLPVGREILIPAEDSPKAAP